MNQRWLFGRDRYRPAGETIDTRRYEVAHLDDDRDAKAFVLAHHYSGTYPAARLRFGLYRGAALVGVAVFSHPCADAVLTNVFQGPVLEAVELGRFVLLDDVPGNGETWFLGQCFRALRTRGIRGVVSFSDPVPRVTADGRRIFPGHIGTIYQAHNGRYTGRGTPRTLRLLPNGQVFSARALQKIRSGDRGWSYAVEQLQRATAGIKNISEPHNFYSRAAWLSAVLPQVTRTVRHPGNHRYVWPLDRRRTIALAVRPYPKSVDQEAR